MLYVYVWIKPVKPEFFKVLSTGVTSVQRNEEGATQEGDSFYMYWDLVVVAPWLYTLSQ